VAFLALPSVCYNLDINSRANRQDTNNPGANIYQDFLRVLQLRYEGTDMALGNMSKLMSGMNLEDATSPNTAISGSDQSPRSHERVPRPSKISGPRKGGNGLEIVVADPQKYIKMAFTLDYFLSRGRFPTKCDLPPNIRSSPGESDGSTSSSMVNHSNADGPSDPVVRTHEHQVGASDPFSQTVNRNHFPLGLPTGSEVLIGSGEGRTGDQDVSVTLTDDPVSQSGLDPGEFSFEDFMTDGPFSGIEQLQTILHSWPSLP
jgi:hypothetical protein